MTDPAADLIVRGGRVYTVDEALPWAEAVAVRGERILAVGNEAEILELAGPSADVLDASGGLVLPGFVDAHNHVRLGTPDAIDLSSATSLEQIHRALRDAVAADPSRWRQDVRADGDAAFAATLEAIAQTAPWFVERTFAAVFGPIAGQALADAGRTLLSIPAAMSQHAASSLGQFAGEVDLVAQRRDVDGFAREVAGIEARVDALAARVEALAAGGGRRRRPKVT